MRIPGGSQVSDIKIETVQSGSVAGVWGRREETDLPFEREGNFSLSRIGRVKDHLLIDRLISIFELAIRIANLNGEITRFAGRECER